jgi:protein TonB
VRKALIGSLLVHAAVTAGVMTSIDFDKAGEESREFYAVKLVAPPSESAASATPSSSPPKPATLKELLAARQVDLHNSARLVEENPDPAEQRKSEEETRETKRDSSIVASHVRPLPTVAVVNPSRFAIDAPAGNNPATQPAPGGAGELDASGSPVPLHITRAGSYAETYVILRAINPTYPQHERDRGIEGSVTVELLVDQFGMVAQATALNLVGPVSFQDAALDAVRQFEFQPPVIDGEPSTMWIKFIIKFRMTD